MLSDQGGQVSNKMLHKRYVPYLLRALILIIVVVVVWQFASVFNLFGTSNQHIIQHEIVVAQADAVNVEVYYESMCPDSKYFILKQLVPAFQKVPEIINVNLKPYGKAKTIENSTGIYFQCQHQEEECQGNKIHACGIKHIQDRKLLMNFVSCLISNIRNPSQAAPGCAQQAGVEWNAIQSCAWSSEGSQLLKGYGEETHALRPSVSFIPTITINGDQGTQSLILKNFLQELCKAYKVNHTKIIIVKMLTTFSMQGEKPSDCT